MKLLEYENINENDYHIFQLHRFKPLSDECRLKQSLLEIALGKCFFCSYYTFLMLFPKRYIS